MLKKIAFGLVAMSLASAANAAILYDANTTTGGIGGFIGDPDAMQVVTLASGGQNATINSFTVFGIRYQTVPTVAPSLRLQFYNNPNLAPAPGVNALAGATLAGSISYNLPTTGVTAATSYNFTLPGPIGIVVNPTLAVRATFFTDSTQTTESNGTVGVTGRYSTGVPAVGSAQAFSYSDDNLDNQFTPDEAFVGQVTPQVALNIRMTIDATVVPEPTSIAALSLGGLILRRRRA